MKVKVKASTTSGKPAGSVIQVSETEGRSLIAKGFATEVKAKKKTSGKSSEGEQSEEG